jgi:hypothetical protein
MNRCARLGTGAALTACLLAVAPTARAQEQPAPVLFKGSDYFRAFLQLHNLKPLRSAEELSDVPPEDAILIVLGDPRGLDLVRPPLRGPGAFLAEGGAVLVATDRADEGRLKDLGLRVSGNAVVVNPRAMEADPELAYGRQRDCPRISIPADSRHPLFQGLGRGLATNRPSYITSLKSRRLHPLLDFPDGCQDGGPHAPFVRGLPTFLYATRAKANGRGDRERGLVIADRTVFMNGMLALPDVDNWVFAWNCVNWLSEGRRRKYALLIEDGSVVSNFDLPLMRLPLPPLKVVGRMLRVVEEENLFNRFILANVPRERILRFLFLGASGLLLLYGLFRLVRAHHRGETAAPMVAALVAQQAEAELPPVALRNEAAVREGNCYEAARDVARLCFEGEGSEAPADPPRVVRGGRQLRRDVEQLWRLAYDATPTPVSPAEFAGLATVAARVRAALDDGSLHAAGTNSANGRGGVAHS